MKMINISLSFATALMFAACQPEFEPVDPIVPTVMSEGAFLSGRVIDTDGNPVPNAVVTDGFVHSAADENGCYRFESPYPDRVKFVSVRVPKEYRPVIRQGRTTFFGSLPAYDGKERTADIVLEKRTNASDDFTMLVIADPQAAPFERKAWWDNVAFASLDIWEDMFSDMKNRVANTTGECYGLCLGDIAATTNNGASVYAPYSIGVASLGIPFYQVIGNHDHFVLDTNLTDDDAAASFEAAFGPRNYSFDLGQFHFVVIDNCIYEKDWRRYPFKYGFEDEFMEWLKSDLSLVPKDVPIMFCSHVDFFDEFGRLHESMVFDNVDCRYKFEEFYETLQSFEFEKIYIWAGHTHATRFTGKVESSPSTNIEAYVVGRSAGGDIQEYLAGDGTPKGYVVLEASGKEIKWKYHTITVEEAPFRGVKAPKYVWKPDNVDESKQMNAYPRGSYDDDCVYANIWLWDKSWETPVLKIGGEEFPMTHDYVYDLGLKEIVTHYNRYGATLKYRGGGNKHGFSVRVPDGASGTGTVSVTDRWGRTWTHDVSVDPIEYNDGMMHKVYDFRTAPSGCPENVTLNVDFSHNGSDFNLSCGLYKKGEVQDDNCLRISVQDGYLVLPSVPGYKLAVVTVHPTANVKGVQSATITDMDGRTVVGGGKLDFYGNTSDSWALEDTQVGMQYKIISNTAFFNIGELRLAYRRVNTGGKPGSADKFEVDNPSDVEF